MFDIGADVIYRIPALLIALTIHEYAHGAVSYSLGDPTPKLQGRLTMNPLAHLDPMGTLMLILFKFGWAKPVQIDASYYKNPKTDMMKVAFAGPGSNLVLGFFGIFFRILFSRLGLLTPGVDTFFTWLIMYNVFFAFFNLIPVPPLDGSKILGSILSPKARYEYNKIAPYSMYILIAIIFTGAVTWIVTPFYYAYIVGVTSFLNIFL